MIGSIQSDAVALIEADAWFEKVTVTASTKGLISATIKEALGRLGRCVVISLVSGPIQYSGSSIMTQPAVEVRVFENVLLRKPAPYKTAEDLMERLMWLFRPGQEVPPPFYLKTWALDNDFDKELCYLLRGETRGKVEVEETPP